MSMSIDPVQWQMLASDHETLCEWSRDCTKRLQAQQERLEQLEQLVHEQRRLVAQLALRVTGPLECAPQPRRQGARRGKCAVIAFTKGAAS